MEDHRESHSDRAGAACVGAALLAAGGRRQPAAACDVQISARSRSLRATIQRRAVRRRASRCLYENNSRTRQHDELDKIRIRTSSARTTTVRQPKTWVGWRYIIQRNTPPHTDGASTTVYRSPVVQGQGERDASRRRSSAVHLERARELQAQRYSGAHRSSTRYKPGSQHPGRRQHARPARGLRAHAHGRRRQLRPSVTTRTRTYCTAQLPRPVRPLPGIVATSATRSALADRVVRVTRRATPLPLRCARTTGPATAGDPRSPRPT